MNIHLLSMLEQCTSVRYLRNAVSIIRKRYNLQYQGKTKQDIMNPNPMLENKPKVWKTLVDREMIKN